MRQRVMKKGLIRSLLALLTVLMMMFGMVQTASAATYEPERKGSFTLTLKEVSDGEENLLPDIELKLYKVGTFEHNGYSHFLLVSSLAATSVDLGQLTTADDTVAAAKKLAEAVGTSSIVPEVAVTGADGVAVFDNLEQGMYLIVQGESAEYVEVAPMLLSIPYMESAEVWLYDVEAFPKVVIHDMPTSLTVTKRVYAFDEELNAVLKTVEDETYTVGLFLDEEGTIPVNENYKKDIHIVNGSSGSVVYENLPEGTYYLYEINEDGVQIPLNEAYENKDGETWSTLITNSEEQEDNEVNIIQPDFTEHEYFVNNYFYEFPDEYYFEGQISITKNVVIDGLTTEVDDTFYAGIFQVKEDETKELLKVVTLKQNATVVTSVPLDIVDGVPVETKYEILETDANGTPVGDDFEYEVSGEGFVVLKEAETPENITITNTKTTPPTATPEPTVTPTVTNPPSGSFEPNDYEDGKVEPVKTGDDTPIAMLVAILVLALGIVTGLVLIMVKRRRS